MPHAGMYSRFERNSMPAPPLPRYVPEKTGQPLRHLLLREAGKADKTIHAPQNKHEWLIFTACASMLFTVLMVIVCLAVLWRWHRRLYVLEIQNSSLVAHAHGQPSDNMPKANPRFDLAS